MFYFKRQKENNNDSWAQEPAIVDVTSFNMEVTCALSAQRVSGRSALTCLSENSLPVNDPD